MPSTATRLYQMGMLRINRQLVDGLLHDTIVQRLNYLMSHLIEQLYTQTK